jgi:SAM-dependent methyltransferase
MLNLLKSRHPGPELMDDPSVADSEFEGVLKILEVINSWLGGYSATTRPLEKLCSDATKTYVIVDVGCGGGDSLRVIDHWAKKKSIKVQLYGVDLSGVAVNYARKMSVGRQITYLEGDCFEVHKLLPQIDIITSSLFTHHLDDKSLEDFVLYMDQYARMGWVINDLHRHWLGYYSIWLITTLFVRNRLVRYDARISVWRGFKKDDYNTLFRKLRINLVKVNWRWAFRWSVWRSC